MTACEIKSRIIAAGLHCYQVAEELGITDSSFSRKLRLGVNEKEAAKIIEVIDKLRATA